MHRWLRTVAVASIFSSLSLGVGCGADVDNDEPLDDSVNTGKGDGASGALAEGTPEAIGVLRMLNSPEITFEMLDDDVPLERRAATNLISHRAGEDGIFEQGAGDDDLYDSIAEVDDVPRVGPVSLGRLLDFAFEMDFVPGGSQLLGTWDSVDFTVDEALATVAFANSATTQELSEVLHDSRPTNALLEARPVASVLQISGLYYFGPVTMGRIKAAADPGAQGALCSVEEPCPAALSCMGQYNGVGKCVDLTVLAGQGDDCISADACEPGLQCSGLTIFETGFCRPLWMAATFENGGMSSIPGVVMDTPSGSCVTVRGLATVPEDIVVEMDLEHTAVHSLVISLRDPNGDESLMWDGPNSEGVAFPAQLLALNISRDDEVNGRWHLLIQNVLGEGEGTLRGWELQLSSRFD